MIQHNFKRLCLHSTIANLIGFINHKFLFDPPRLKQGMVPILEIEKSVDLSAVDKNMPWLVSKPKQFVTGQFLIYSLFAPKFTFILAGNGGLNILAILFSFKGERMMI